MATDNNPAVADLLTIGAAVRQRRGDLADGIADLELGRRALGELLEADPNLDPAAAAVLLAGYERSVDAIHAALQLELGRPCSRQLADDRLAAFAGVLEA